MPSVAEIQNKAGSLVTEAGEKIVFAKTPFYLNLWFWITVICIFIVIGIIVWLWINIWTRNRLVVRILMPDRTLANYVYKKFSGNSFHIKGRELDKENKPILQEYKFDSTCVYVGKYGRYIDYDYGIMQPRKLPGGNSQYPKDVQFFEFISGLLNTDLAVDLLLSSKFKDFVKMMLIVIVIITVIIVIITGYNLMYIQKPHLQMCTLIGDNQTISVIRSAFTPG